MGTLLYSNENNTEKQTSLEVNAKVCKFKSHIKPLLNYQGFRGHAVPVSIIYLASLDYTIK